MSATGDRLTAAKAWTAAVFGLLAPGAAYVIGASQDGMSGSDWLVAAAFVVTGGAVAGGAVYAVENKPKPQYARWLDEPTPGSEGNPLPPRR